jgi:hypothetical protein
MTKTVAKVSKSFNKFLENIFDAAIKEKFFSQLKDHLGKKKLPDTFLVIFEKATKDFVLKPEPFNITTKSTRPAHTISKERQCEGKRTTKGNEGQDCKSFKIGNTKFCKSHQQQGKSKNDNGPPTPR